jgi:hypothetical protein
MPTPRRYWPGCAPDRRPRNVNSDAMAVKERQGRAHVNPLVLSVAPPAQHETPPSMGRRGL